MSETIDPQTLAIFNKYKALCEDIELKRGKYKDIYEEVKLADLPGKKERLNTRAWVQFISLIGGIGLLASASFFCVPDLALVAILGIGLSIGLFYWSIKIDQKINVALNEDLLREKESHEITLKEIQLRYPGFDEFYDLWLETKKAQADERNRKLLKGAAIAGAIVVGVTGAMAVEAYKETNRS